MSLNDIKLVDYILDKKVVNRYNTALSIGSNVSIKCDKLHPIDDSDTFDSLYKVVMTLDVYDVSKEFEKTEDKLISDVKVQIQVVAKTEPEKNDDDVIELELLKQSYEIIQPMILSELEPLKINDGVFPDDVDSFFANSEKTD